MEYTLQHHGVKGQKWGVRRRFKNYLARQRNAKKRDVIRRGDIEYIKKHPEKFTDKQIEAARNRKSELLTLPTGSKTADKINSFNNKLQGGKSNDKQNKTFDQKIATASNVVGLVTKMIEGYNKAYPIIQRSRDKKKNAFLEEAQNLINKQDKAGFVKIMDSVPLSMVEEFNKRRDANRNFAFDGEKKD